MNELIRLDLPGAGRAGDQHVRHRREVDELRAAVDVLAERDRQRMAVVPGGLRAQDVAEHHEVADLVRHLDADGRLARDRRDDPDVGRRERVRDVVGEAEHLVDLGPGLDLDLEERDGRARGVRRRRAPGRRTYGRCARARPSCAPRRARCRRPAATFEAGRAAGAGTGRRRPGRTRSGTVDRLRLPPRPRPLRLASSRSSTTGTRSSVWITRGSRRRDDLRLLFVLFHLVVVLHAGETHRGSAPITADSGVPVKISSPRTTAPLHTIATPILRDELAERPRRERADRARRVAQLSRTPRTASGCRAERQQREDADERDREPDEHPQPVLLGRAAKEQDTPVQGEHRERRRPRRRSTADEPVQPAPDRPGGLEPQTRGPPAAPSTTRPIPSASRAQGARCWRTDVRARVAWTGHGPWSSSPIYTSTITGRITGLRWVTS